MLGEWRVSEWVFIGSILCVSLLKIFGRVHRQIFVAVWFECPPGYWVVGCLIPGRVQPKTQKIVLMPLCLVLSIRDTDGLGVRPCDRLSKVCTASRYRNRRWAVPAQTRLTWQRITYLPRFVLSLGLVMDKSLYRQIVVGYLPQKNCTCWKYWPTEQI